MNPYLTRIQEQLLNSQLTEQEKKALLNSLSEADKHWAIAEFKLDRTEKVKKTTAILLEETIVELEKKRKAVENQNRKLEIETALEKVRAVAMGMSKSEDLVDICEILFNEFRILGFDELRNTMINIHDDERSSFVNYDYSDEIGKSITPLVYNIHPVIEKQIREIRSADDAFSETVFAGKDLEEWKKFRKERGEKDDPRIDDVNGLHYYFYSIGSGSIGISTFAPIDSEKLALLKRFRNVFILAYQRYTDITKATAQAREAKIEAALERTRTQSMLMQHSNELDNTLRVFHEQVLLLGIHSAFSFLWLPDEDDDRHIFWAVWAENVSDDPLAEKGCSVFQSKAIDYPLDRNDPATTQCLIDWKGKESVVSYHVPPDGVETYFAAWQELFARAEQLKPEYYSDGLYYVEAFMKYGCFGVMIKDELPEEERKILSRFATEFERTYTRFLDLQKAEAQAREAQIEAALERVRSRTMAMHKTDELLLAAELVSKELSALGITSMNVSYAFIDNDEKSASYYSVNPLDGKVLPFPFVFPHNQTEVMRSILSSWEKQEPFNLLTLDEEGTIKHQTWVGEHIQKLMTENGIPFFLEEFLDISPKTAVIYSFNFAQGYLFNIGEDRLTAMQEEMVLRFTKVFEMTYRRFLDLQKAEAQAREAQIEAALERVRSRSMAMQKSDELKEVIQVVFEQFNHLSINIEHTGFVIDYKERDDYYIWLADPLGVPSQVTISYFDSVYYNQFNEAKEKGDDFFATKLDFEEKNRFYQKLFEYIPGLSDEAKAFYFNCPGLAASTVLLENIALYIENFSGIPYSDEENATLMRFGKVFQQTYTRFLDLQNAEEQAREGQIQLAMERVRARTMAMQKSDELTETASLLFEQVSALGIRTWTAGFNIWSEDNNSYVDYISSPTGGFIEPYTVYTDAAEALSDIRNARKSGVEFDVLYVEGEKIKQLYMALTRLDEKAFDIMLKDGGQFPSHQYEHFAFGSKISLMFITYEPVPEAHDIFKRFGKVFEQTYTRFLDLQKAEAQAREAKVEASLEKVRSRTMAMQRSSELADVATVLFQQVKALGIPQWTCGFNIWELGDKEFTFYAGSPDGDILPPYKVPLTEDPTFKVFDESRRRGDELFVYEKTGERQKAHYKYMLSLKGGLGDFLQGMLDNGITFPEFQIDHLANFSHGNLLFITYEHFPEMHDIFKRFAKVFDQTYTRFLDLQKAEAQAREAQIETALEKIRSRTMAMQRSDELGEAALLLFQQVKVLGVKLFGCGFNIWDEDKKAATAWMAGDDRIQPPFKTSSSEDVFKRIFDAAQKGERLFVEEMSGEDNQTHYRYMLSIPDFRKIVEQFKFSIPEFQVMHCAFFSQGYLMFISFEPIPEAHDLFIRFAKVFEQTYTRFLDLQKAEALAKEALKQASLDRIRGQVASMRSAGDLEHIIPMLWHELGVLGIPFIRCGVFIMNEADSIVNVYLSSPDGKSLGLLHLPFDTGGVTQNSVEHWRKKKVYKEHWNREEFIAWMQTLIAAGQVHDSATYQGAAAPPESLYLHFVPFKQGMLYVGSAEALHHDIIEVLKTLASTFSIAYSRYEDFRLLEDAKNRIETTLVELKATQSQLVQSEKMASLGELTAGIAHEIQNPLNFVNNFSELSNELIEEMEEEMKKGNSNEVNNIISDLRSNLEKINQHGRRADSIVKGMLQHSRASTGEKEATDINALADEYLRLAYHGFRAKDKSFNAILETDLDQSIGKIKAVPQELGRVLLNLYNNAFYAVNEKSGIAGYEPKVRLSTTKTSNGILIAVQDNGKGIPEKVREKIFQPFFTTKPTGQGTGLGLSLSYDIVKAHGGEFRVDSKEGEGTSFVIQLPV